MKDYYLIAQIPGMGMPDISLHSSIKSMSEKQHEKSQGNFVHCGRLDSLEKHELSAMLFSIIDSKPEIRKQYNVSLPSESSTCKVYIFPLHQVDLTITRRQSTYDSQYSYSVSLLDGNPVTKIELITLLKFLA